MADPVAPTSPRAQWRQEELGATKGVEVPLKGLFDLSGQVVLVDVRGEKEMAPVLEHIKSAGGQALAVQCDVRDRAQVDAAVKQAVDQFGRLDCMVANAGILGKLCRAESVPEESWREVMGINVEGAYNCAAAAYPHMKSAGRGKVILTSSIAGVRGFGAQVPYGTSKGALLPMAKSLAVAWGKDSIQARTSLLCARVAFDQFELSDRLRVVWGKANIQVNVLIPGAINTPFLDSVLNTPEKVNEILRRIPAGRLGVPEDLAGPALFLASRASDYVTGAEIVVDGGGIQMPMLGGQTPEEYQAPMPTQGQTATIHSLPDDLLARCLVLLSEQDRFASAALVSKRFHALAGSPERLSLSIGTEDEPAPIAAGCAGCACCSPGCSAMAAACGRLSYCTWGGGETDSGAQQVSILKGLRSLHLFRLQATDLSAIKVGSLSRLQQLQHLSLDECTIAGWLPATAPHLTSLQALEIVYPQDDKDTSKINSTLRALPQLRGLWLEAHELRSVVPRAAAALSQLQWLCINPGLYNGKPVLPSGPWQRNLRHFLTRCGVAEANVPFLEGLPCLERISLVTPPCKGKPTDPDAQWHQFWRWAARHPPLRCLEFPAESEDGKSAGFVAPEVVTVVAQLAAARPQLRIECLAGPAHMADSAAAFRKRVTVDHGATIHHLPDDLLARCLALVPQKDRFTSAALVDKRFHALTGSPETLRLHMGGLKQYVFLPAALPRLRTLQPWLLRHSSRLQELELQAQLAGGSSDNYAEAASLLTSCLAAGATGGALQRLVFRPGTLASREAPLELPASWAGSLHGLRHLSISYQSTVRLQFSLAALSQLESLQLEVKELVLGADAALPPFLKSLSIWCSQQLQHRFQMDLLTRLQHLRLRSKAYPSLAAPVDGLSTLRALRCLSLEQCPLGSWLSAAAAHWGSLRVLEVLRPIGEVESVLEGALCVLRQLTGLYLETAALPAASASLAQLAWLHWSPGDHFGAWGAQLPAGPVQRTLRHAVLDWTVAKANLAFLRACPQLDRLSLVAPPWIEARGDAQWDAFWAWAASGSPLRRLDFRAGHADDVSLGARETVPYEALNAAVQVALALPSLRIECLPHTWEGYREELLADWYTDP
ncbi:hypothetical protein ABPG75_010277 [Micractinium tetrahymenae]